MKAWRMHKAGEIRLDKIQAQDPTGQCAKVKVSYASLSAIDSMLYTGELSPQKMPFTIGSQAVGMVTEVGEGVTNVVRGDRVVIDPYLYCEGCDPCAKGKFVDCVDLKMYGVYDDGFMSDFCIVRSEDLFKLPDRVKDEEAIFAAHIALAMNIMAKLELEKGEHVVIMGASLVGIILAQVALYYQAIPILVDTRGDRLSIAENLGVYYCVNSTVDDARKKIFSMTGGSMASAVVYFTGTNSSLPKSLEYAASGGRVVVAGWSGTKPDLAASFSQVFSKQLTVYGVSNGAKMIPAAINMLANRTVNVTPFVKRTIAFENVDEALKTQVDHPDKDIKVLVKM